jgi:hypothetical protein
MVGKNRHNRAIHEASHAVIARKLDVPVPRVTVTGSAQAEAVSAAYYADKSDVAAWIVGYETDAKIALAGLAANRIEHPHLRVFELSKMMATQPMRGARFIASCASTLESQG